MGDVLVTRDSSRPQDGTGRDGYGTGLRDVPNPIDPYLTVPLTATATCYRGLEADLAADRQRELLARRIAKAQLRQVDELSLIGYPTSWDEATRAVVAEALHWAALRELER